MQTRKRVAAFIMAVLLVGAIVGGCRASKRQGCPTFNSIDLTLQQSDIFNG